MRNILKDIEKLSQKILEKNREEIQLKRPFDTEDKRDT